MQEKLAVRHAELQARQEAITAQLHARLSNFAVYMADQKAAPGIRTSALEHAKEDVGYLPSAAASVAARRAAADADTMYKTMTPEQRRAAAATRLAAASAAMAALAGK